MNKRLIIFACKKGASCLLSLWIIITLTFFLMKSIPGSPLEQEQALSRQIHTQLSTYYGLDKPLLEQYATYLENILSFDLGFSLIHSGRKNSDIILEGFPASAFLGMEALCLTFFIGISLGTFSAIHYQKKVDQLTGVLIVIFLSIPSFILAGLLQYFLAIQWEWLPVARFESFAHTLMPALALAAAPTAFLTKLVRVNIIHVLKQDYIFLARAKGLGFYPILWRHVLSNALVPLLGYFGKMSANILVGSFIIEKIFSIPGLGYWFVSSIATRDYPLIMGLTIFYSIILLGALWLADLIHALLDSRLYRNQEGMMS